MFTEDCLVEDYFDEDDDTAWIHDENSFRPMEIWDFEPDDDDDF